MTSSEIALQNFASRIQSKRRNNFIPRLSIISVLAILGLSFFFNQPQKISPQAPVMASDIKEAGQSGILAPTPSPTPEIAVSKVQEGVLVSFYDRSVCVDRVYGENCKTANGEVFNDENLTLANKTLPFNTKVEITYKGRSVICRVNDRGPYVDGRGFDLSRGCAEQLGMISKGVAKVNFKIVYE